LRKHKNRYIKILHCLSLDIWYPGEEGGNALAAVYLAM
jgi:hypothetical protein